MISSRLAVIGGVVTGLVGIVAPIAGQSTSTQTLPSAVISGRIVDAVTGSPIAGVTVELWPADERPVPSRGTPAITDDSGRYEFRNVAAGQYRVESVDTDRRYLAGSWGMVSPGDHCCRKVVLKTGERVGDVDIRLWPGVALAGRVTDEHGEPLVHVVVRYLRREFLDGRRTWVAGSLGSTDDRGRFASGPGLRPGEFLVVLPGTQRDARTGTPPFETVYYGGVRLASQATAVRLAFGERREDLDLQATLTPGARSLRVEGRVTANGQPLPGAIVELVPRDSDDSMAHLDGTRIQSTAKGEFTFEQVSGGDYRLRAWQFPRVRANNQILRSGAGGGFGSFKVEFPPPLPDDPTWIGDRVLSLTKSALDVELPMRTAPRLTGQIRVAGSAKPPPPEALARMQMNVMTTHGRDLGLIPVGGFEPDGRFHTAGLPPGEYLLRPVTVTTREAAQSGTVPRGPFYSLVSLHVDGREQPGEAVSIGASDVAVVVTVTNQSWELSGVVRDSTGRTVPGGRVVLFPQDRARWHRVAFGTGPVHRTMADHLGAYRATGVLPGDYLVAAVNAPAEDWMTAEYLETLVPLATAVRLGLGEKRSVELRLTRP